MSKRDSFNKNNYLDFFRTQEFDRKRISNELHDTSIQDLTHIIHQIELAGLYIDMDSTKAKLELASINDEIRKIIKDIRNIIFDLRPMSFDDLGLSDAINQFIDNLKSRYDVEIETQLDFADNYNEQRRLEIYRIIQECLTNAVKHANADTIKLIVKDKKEGLCLSIIDNGIGIANNPDEEKNIQTHYGLLIMKERVSILNGKCYISSKEDEGTKIQIVIPE